MVTQLDYKAIREDRLAEATRIAREKGWKKGWKREWAEGAAEGRLKGEAEGKLLGRQETASAMLREGMSPETVACFTRLSLDEVEALKRS